MTARPAVAADKWRVVEMLRDAHQAGGLPFPFSAPHAAVLFDGCVGSKDRLALVHEAAGGAGGVLLASSQPHPFAPITYASEIVWWIDPEHRSRGAASEMLAAYERWACDAGCTFVGMAALATEPRAGLIYQRRGYVAAETYFIKSLAPATAA